MTYEEWKAENPEAYWQTIDGTYYVYCNGMCGDSGLYGLSDYKVLSRSGDRYYLTPTPEPTPEPIPAGLRLNYHKIRHGVNMWAVTIESALGFLTLNLESRIVPTKRNVLMSVCADCRTLDGLVLFTEWCDRTGRGVNSTRAKETYVSFNRYLTALQVLRISPNWGLND